MKTKTFWLHFLLLSILITAFFLRMYNVTHLSPYWEEVALGYDAYSILKTGQDHHGNSWPVVAFESFGDWKPSFYFYAVVPFIQLFGLNIWAVRFPSILSGVALVGGVGALAFIVSQHLKKEARKLVCVTAMGVTAISPWALMFSRVAWEVNLATALIVWGVITGLLAPDSRRQKRLILLILSAFLLVLSMYTYHAARMLAPFLGMGIGLLFIFKERFTIDRSRLVHLGVVGVFSLILVLPLLLSFGSPEINQRFAETSIFSDLSIIEESNTLKAAAGNSLVSRIFYHRYVFFGREIIQNYLAHFRLDFLFMSGDLNPRHSIQYFGHLYHLEFIFLLLGAYYFFKYRNRYHAFLLVWLLIGIIPASITHAAPHALRILPTLPVWMILISYGIFYSYTELTHLTKNWVPRYSRYQPYLIALLILLFYFVEFTAFWRYYTRIYPPVQAHEWQFGYEQLVTVLESKRKDYSTVYITREYGRPAMYYWFYTQTAPQLVQANNEAAQKDQGEILSYENIHFIRSVAEIDQVPALVASSEESWIHVQNQRATRVLETITSPTGKTVWVLYEVKE